MLLVRSRNLGFPQSYGLFLRLLQNQRRQPSYNSSRFRALSKFEFKAIDLRRLIIQALAVGPMNLARNSVAAEGVYAGTRSVLKSFRNNENVNSRCMFTKNTYFQHLKDKGMSS